MKFLNWIANNPGPICLSIFMITWILLINFK